MNAPVDVSFFARAAKPLTSYRPYWAKRFGTAPFLPMSRAEMDKLGWDSCDIILVTGDAYVDHPSFGMAVIGRTLEAQGFRVGIIAQPDWQSAEPFKVLGKPNLFWGVTAGNMDSMINRYTADRKIRSDDAYTPGDIGGKRPDRAAIVYSQRCREAYKDVPIVLGGIEGSLRRIAHYDYWSDKVRRSIVVDSKCDLLLYGNAERAIVEIAHRLAAREPVQQITDVRGTAFVRRETPEGWFEIDSTSVDTPGHVEAHINPYLMISDQAREQGATCAREEEAKEVAEGHNAKNIEADLSAAVAQARTGQTAIQPIIQPLNFVPNPALRGKGTHKVPPRDKSVIRLPSYEQVKQDAVLYAHANRVLHLETNPGNARALVQAHGEGVTARDVWINPPPIPLTTAEMDHVFDLPYARSPHPTYADENGRHDGPTKIPAWEMIRFSVNIMRGCFGGCTFCSITEHEGRIIQSRSEESIIKEVEDIRDKVEGFTGVISDLGGPTANMYRLGCRTPEIEAACRKIAFEAEIGHDGGDDAGPREPAILVPALGNDRHQLVPVHHMALFVHDHDPVGIPVEGDADIRQKNFSNETRVTFGEQQDTLSGIAGLYLARTDSDEILYYGGISDFDDTKRNLGVFGEVSYRLNDRWTLTTALRFQQDQIQRTGTSPFATDGLDYDKTFNAFLPKVSLAYALTPQWTVGGMVSRGYNPGGVSLNMSSKRFEQFDETRPQASAAPLRRNLRRLERHQLDQSCGRRLRGSCRLQRSA